MGVRRVAGGYGISAGRRLRVAENVLKDEEEICAP